jgi:hypothetical protein
MKLLPQFLNLIQQWRPCFADYRTHRRAVGFRALVAGVSGTPHHQPCHLCAAATVSKLGRRLQVVLAESLESTLAV